MLDALQAVPRGQISASVRSLLARRMKHCVPDSPAPSIHPPTSTCGWSPQEETAGAQDDGELQFRCKATSCRSLVSPAYFNSCESKP